MTKVKILEIPDHIELDIIFTGKKYPKHYKFLVGESFDVKFELNGVEQTLTIPAMFESDLASVPKIPFIYGELKLAAMCAPLVHDYVYANGTYSRSVCDLLLREIAIKEGATKTRAYALWSGVRVGGWLYYKDKHPTNKG